MQRIAGRNGPEVLPTDFAACNTYAGGLEAARALRCPALFVLGGDDVMTAPRAAKALIDACAKASLVQVDGGGHSLMAERPDAVLRHFACSRRTCLRRRRPDADDERLRALLNAVNWDTYWLYVLTEVALSLSPGRRSCW